MVFLENFAKMLLNLHGFIAVLSLVTLGVGIYLLYKKAKIDWNAGLQFSFIGIIAYVISFILGLLIYPVFRIKVRAEYFDAKLPWLTGLFEIKEYVGAIGLFIALSLLAYYYFFKIGDAEKPIKQSFINLLFILFLITLFEAITGVILVAYRSI